jgi:uncharacterized protein YyaL (SSP411 family)
VFSQPKIEELFHRYVTVRLHTDRVPDGTTQVPDAAGARAFRDDKLGNGALPYYVVLQPEGKTLYKTAFYPNPLIKDVKEFADFLEKNAVWRPTAGAR